MNRPILKCISMILGVGLMLLGVSAHAQRASGSSNPGADLSNGQAYPAKPVRVVAGSPGTMSDIVSRLLGSRLSERWGQTVIVDNRGGGNATIAANVVAKALPDGYSLLMGQIASHAAAPHLLRKLPYDPVRDFKAITLVAKAPFVLIAHPSVPAEGLPQLVDYARKHPGQLSYAAAGSGTASNLTMVMFRMRAGLDMLYVPYKGNAAALTAILAREAQLSFSPVPVALPHIATGRLKVYAISSLKRYSGAPDIPTVGEGGMPGFESTTWFGMMAPASTSAALLVRLNRDVGEILQTPSFMTALLAQGAESSPGSPEEFAAFIKSETAKWGQVITAAGIKAE